MDDIKGPRAGGAVLEAVFRHIVCINLDRRPDRWRRVRRRLDEQGFGAVLRFPAVDGRDHVPPDGWPYSAGAYGCLMSHVGVVRAAVERGWSDVLVLEDDVVFDPRLGQRFGAQVQNVPDDWDSLFLGGIHRSDPTPVAGEVFRLTSTNSTFAYALRAPLYGPFLDLHAVPRIPVDEGNRRLQATHRFYGFFPNLAWIEEDDSDIAGRRVHHWWAEQSLVLDGREFAEAARDVVVLLPTSVRAGDDPRRPILESLARRHARLSPELVVVVLPFGGGPPPELRDLPPNVRVKPVSDGRGRAWEAGYREWATTRSRFVLADDSTYLPNWDLKACILMSGRHDVVRCAGAAVELDATETASALANRLTEIDASPHRRRPYRGALDGMCVLTRRAMASLDWDAGEPVLRGPGACPPGLSVFEAPGWSFQLHPRS